MVASKDPSLDTAQWVLLFNKHYSPPMGKSEVFSKGTLQHQNVICYSRNLESVESQVKITKTSHTYQLYSKQFMENYWGRIIIGIYYLMHASKQYEKKGQTLEFKYSWCWKYHVSYPFNICTVLEHLSPLDLFLQCRKKDQTIFRMWLLSHGFIFEKVNQLSQLLYLVI